MFKLQRMPDYPPEMHTALDRYEAAANALEANSMTEEAWDAALKEYEEAHCEYGKHVLALHRHRQALRTGKPVEPVLSDLQKRAKYHVVDLEQCSLVVDSAPLARAMTDAAAFLRERFL